MQNLSIFKTVLVLYLIHKFSSDFKNVVNQNMFQEILSNFEFWSTMAIGKIQSCSKSFKIHFAWSSCYFCHNHLFKTHFAWFSSDFDEFCFFDPWPNNCFTKSQNQGYLKSLRHVTYIPALLRLNVHLYILTYVLNFIYQKVKQLVHIMKS